MASSRVSVGMLYGLAIGWIFFLIALVAAIMISTKVEKANADRAAAISDLARYASPADKSNPTVDQLLSSEGTVVGQLLDEVQVLKVMVVGEPNKQLSLIKSDVLQPSRAINDSTLIRKIDSLLAEVNVLGRSMEEAETRINAEIERANAAERSKNQLAASFASGEATLAEQVAAAEARADDLLKKTSDSSQELQRSMSTAERDWAQKESQYTSTIASQVQELDVLREKYRELQTQRDATLVAKPDPSLLVDGVIVSVRSDQNLVYINRGRTDRILLGTTFEVYDQSIGVVANEAGEYFGKATVEVINVDESFSVARIIRSTPGKEVLENDIIANAVYDPNMTFRFYVFGEFDIDKIGESSRSDRRRVESMIVQWGGELASSPGEQGQTPLTYDVDFLVLGEKPEQPDPLDPGVTDSDAIRLYELALRRFSRYTDLVGQAQELSIPVLNQNRFLTMVGYHSR